MSIQLDQFTNTISVNDTVNANSSLNLVGQGTGAVTLKGTGQNLLLQSQTLATSPWTANSITATNNSTTAPDSTNTATLLTASVGAAAHYDFSGGTPVFNQGITYTVSFYAKSGTTRYVQFVIGGTASVYANFDTTAGTVGTTAGLTNSSITSIGSGWYRCVIVFSYSSTGASGVGIAIQSSASDTRLQSWTAAGTETIYIWGVQTEIGSVANTYIPTTTTAVYGTPSLSFSGVAGLGLQSDGSLYVSPAGTGALQAQATTSTATGGNARGANAVDWQTSRTNANQVANGGGSVIAGGVNNRANGFYSSVSGGNSNAIAGAYGIIGSGNVNTASSDYCVIGGGASNTAAGLFNFIGAGFTNSGTSGAAVTTQATTIAITAGTTFYLSATNANIKVGQYITGTGVANNTYATSTVTTGTAAVMNTSTISGTTLTVGTLASGTIIAGMVLTGTGVTAGTYIVSGSGSSWTVSTSQTVASTTITGTAYTFTISQNATTAAGVTLSFYTPHGVVVGGGNNQASGAYSFVGGGGDAGVAANRNVASGDWSFVGGGKANTASGSGSVVAGGGYGYSNISSGLNTTVSGGGNNQATGSFDTVTGGFYNYATGAYGTAGGRFSTTRGIYGEWCYAAGNTNLIGDAQAALLVLRVGTTDATATVLTSNASAASNNNQVILPNNSAYYFRGEVIAGVTGAGNTKGWFIEGVIKRGSGVGTTALVGTPTVTSLYADAGASTWTIAVTADTTNGGLTVTFTGQAATTIRTVAQIRTTEMTY
jgi:hypothetical protein